MWRLLNFIAMAVFIASAGYAYGVKYETILFAEQILKTKHDIGEEQDAIARLHAEWALLTRPERLQALADKHSTLKPLALTQIVSLADLPNRPPKVDGIGRELESLGLGQPTTTPTDRKAAGTAATPSSAR